MLEKVSMPTPLREIDWQRFDELKAQGLPMLRISKVDGNPGGHLAPACSASDMTRQSAPKAHHDTPKEHPSSPDDPEL